MSSVSYIQIPNLKPGAVVQYNGFDYTVQNILIRQYNLYVKLEGYDHVIPLDQLVPSTFTIKIQRGG